MTSRSDAELIAAARTSAAAFRELYDRHADPIFAFALRRTGDREAALDITAETFCQAWRSLATFQDVRSGSAGPWLFGIARNVVSKSARDRRLQRAASQALGLELRESDAVVPGPDWLIGMDADLEQAMQALPSTQRRAVELRVLAERSYADVADELDCTEGAARIKVSRGLAGMRTHMNTTREEK